MAKTDNTRRFPGETSRNRPDFANLRREEAAQRQAAYEKLSTKDKIEKLDIKFGKDQGAAKVRKKLAEQKQPKQEKQVSEEVLQEIKEINKPNKKSKKEKHD